MCQAGKDRVLYYRIEKDWEAQIHYYKCFGELGAYHQKRKTGKRQCGRNHEGVFINDDDETTITAI